MNSNLAEELCVIVIVAVAFFIIGMSVVSSAYNDQLKARGLKEYDRATGRLIWTEKAGGEKGGGK